MLIRPGNDTPAAINDVVFPGHRVSPVRRRIVVVGLGSIGRRHARLLAARPDVVLEICDPAADALAKARAELGNVPVHADFAAALRSQPHAVVIATPHTLHARQATAAMQAGADVLCEKPMCMTGDEARTMITWARQTGRTLAVGFQLHFHRGLLRVRKLIQTGVIGQVAHLHVRVGSYITLRNSASRYQQSLRGALLLDYVHQPDLITWLLGELPAGVTLTGFQAGGMPLTSEPNVMALTLDYQQPLLATVHLNYLQMPQRHEWEIVGDKGWLLLDADRGTLRIGLRETETERLETVAADRDEAYRHEHQAFMDCLDGQRGPESAGPAAARSVELYAMAMTSLAEGRRVACHWCKFD
ncbi:MAG: Gfo/Idh/MocA family oxidoreductase [Opitutaceae bacterium]|nr:Gfo/Idh/MocA family oxidoreductase [Opitutaceae bacterium]